MPRKTTCFRSVVNSGMVASKPSITPIIDISPPGLAALRELREVGTADNLEDMIYTLVIGESQRFFFPIRRAGAINIMACAEQLYALEFVITQ